MAVTMTGVGACISACVSPSDFVRTISSTIMDEFHNNLTQLFAITCRCTI